MTKFFKTNPILFIFSGLLFFSTAMKAEDLDLRSGKKIDQKDAGLDALMTGNNGELNLSEKDMRALIGQIYGGKTYKGKKINQLNQVELKEFLMEQLKSSKSLVNERTKALDDLMEE
ncbi:MAG: hypothetical protein VX583_11155 [Bdellovibrionota bacterium]|nr:hypothetical protein [Pseudobdellovibrionaceae bacterium]